MFSDTIAAIATPHGRGALALIRISGPEAFALASGLIPDFDTGPARAHVSTILAQPEGEPLDQVVYTVYRGPASYTGEDVVEISAHGGLLIPISVLEAVLAAGARPARPGEFTMRAVLNGKMDLLQAEAVADLIDSKAPAQRRAALAQLDRGLSVRIDSLRSRALEIQVLISYDIDFPEEDDGPLDPTRIESATGALLSSIDSLLETSKDGEMLREGALVVIAGRPNSGKSSLFNALVGFDRAIVTEIEGTTRDAIEAPVTCEGFPFRLVDTAGLRESDDTVEKLGIEVSRKYVRSADIVLLCVEAGRDPASGELEFIEELEMPAVLVRTKADLCRESSPGDGVAVSSVTGAGLAELRTTLAQEAFGNALSGARTEAGLTRTRHRAALTRARSELSEFSKSYSAGVDAVVAAVHLRSCVEALEEIIGVVTTEDVLSALFSDFCVGK